MSEEGEEKHVTVVKNATDLQRLKLEKLMSNCEKLAFIPDRPKDKKFSEPAEFVRNVMGSSAGAGSGEFHVYRHIRRREYARQDFLQQCKEKDELDIEYHLKLENNKRVVEEKAAKNRAKRHRQKERQRAKRQKVKELKKMGISEPRESSSSEQNSDVGEAEELSITDNQEVDRGKQSSDTIDDNDGEKADEEEKGEK